MKGLRGLLIVLTAISLASLLLLARLAWVLHDTTYLRSVEQRSDIVSALSRELPNYAAEKLPEPDQAKQVFAAVATPELLHDILGSLDDSIVGAYHGTSSGVELSLAPLLDGVANKGYEIPPGTVFASSTIQVNGLAPVLHGAARGLAIVALLAAVVIGLLTLATGSKRWHNLGLSLIVTAIFLVGFFAVSQLMPTLLSSLLTSSRLNQTMAELITKSLKLISNDAGMYALVCAALLTLAGTALMVMGLLQRRRVNLPSAEKPKRRRAPEPPRRPNM